MLWTTLLYGLPRDYFPTLISKLQKFTPDDLADIQREYFDISRWAVGASGVTEVVLPAIQHHVADVEVMHIQSPDA
jgi:late competence protein required for DNA uptake (superfamily II DNA/RNA helicase)